MRIHKVAAALLISLLAIAPAWPQEPDKLFQPGFTRVGEHYSKVDKGSAQKCQDACVEDGVCRAWVFETVPESCRLMSQSPPVEPQEDACCTTGIKQN